MIFGIIKMVCGDYMMILACESWRSWLDYFEPMVLVHIVLGQGRSKWIQNRAVIKELFRHITIFMCNPLEEIKLISYLFGCQQRWWWGSENMIGFYLFILGN